jgi:predicted DNA-binding transcriptional regulator AlpA
MQETINLTRLAQLTKISRRTLYKMIADGRFPVAPIAGTKPPRWSLQAVTDWVCGNG